MRILTLLTATALVTAAAGPSVAASAAAPAPHGCVHLIVDPRGDAKEWFLPGTPYNPDADLLYLDTGTTATTMTLTVTLARVQAKPVTGTNLVVYFTVNHQGTPRNFQVDLAHNIDGDSYILQDNDTQAVTPISGTTNTVTGRFTLSVPRKAINADHRGAVLAELGVIVAQTVGSSNTNGGFIEQSTGPEYKYVVDGKNICRKR